jgi:hypothetical protein
VIFLGKFFGDILTKSPDISPGDRLTLIRKNLPVLKIMTVNSNFAFPKKYYSNDTVDYREALRQKADEDDKVNDNNRWCHVPQGKLL